MKKIFFSLFSLILLFGFCIGCQKEESTAKEEVKDKIEGSAYHVGYLSDLEDSSVILDNYNDFRDYFKNNSKYDDILNEYKEDFFENKSLAVKYITLSSGSITITDVYGKVDGNKVIISYEENVPEIGTADMSGYFVIVEVPKNITTVE